MDFVSIILLLFAGIVGGAISSLAGGASVITFPILLATGITPVSAACTNTVALTPGNIAAAIYERAQLPALGRSFVLLVIGSVLATLAGGALLLLTPERVFAVLIPVLLGFATVLFAYAGPITEWIKARGAGRPHSWTGSIVWLMPVSVYGGYFGAGLGVLVLGVLSIATGGDYRSANVTKNLVISINSITVSAFFIANGIVAFPQVLVMMAGAVAGGFIGGRIARRVPNALARRMVVVVGAVLTIAFAWRYWF
ncbi:MAG: sulfite exporter TauE/SafE family protein [Xanthobacteraceae bacterium]